MDEHVCTICENIVRDNDDYVNGFAFNNLIGMGIARKCVIAWNRHTILRLFVFSVTISQRIILMQDLQSYTF